MNAKQLALRTRTNVALLTSALLFSSALLVPALAAEEQINKRFTVQPGGTLVVEVEQGLIDVRTNSGSDVVIDVYRKVTRGSTKDEETYLKEHPVVIAEENGSVSIKTKGKSSRNWSWTGRNRNEAKYVVTVPGRFNTRLQTAGGSITVEGLEGDVKARTSGGSLTFARLHGLLDGDTSGGSIRVTDCEGELRVGTSGGSIDLAGGAGSFKGGTSGGSVSVKQFKGPTKVETSGGGITISGVTGRIEGETSGGSIKAVLFALPTESVKLSTSGGGVSVQVPNGSAFHVNAETSGGGVDCEFPVTITGKRERNRLNAPVNGGGPEIYLRSSGGGIHVQKGEKVLAEQAK